MTNFGYLQVHNLSKNIKNYDYKTKISKVPQTIMNLSVKRQKMVQISCNEYLLCIVFLHNAKMFGSSLITK